MKCRRPFVKKGAQFGCGQCMPCRVNKRRVWSSRMILEAACHSAASFVTLTYNEENIPDAGTLVPRDLQLWLKRFRKSVGPGRFFAVGEYGDQSWRPHYHVALYGYGREYGNCISQTWGKGYVDVGDLTPHSACYIAGYTTKKMTSKDDPRLQYGLHPEFARMSLRPGIGAPAIASIATALRSRAGERYINDNGDVPSVLRNEGREIPIGRYLRGRLRGELEFEFKQENPTKVFQKTAEMHALFKAYKASKGISALTLTQWREEKQKQIRFNEDGKLAIKRSKTL